MSETTYTIEHAKSGRAKCKRCKEPIVKGALRIGTIVKASEEGGFDMTSWNHVDCFRMPRKFVNGSLQMTVEEFFQDMVTDTSDDNDILPDKLDDLVSRVEAAMASSTKKTAKKAKKETDASTIMGRLKQAMEEDDEQPAKKQKKDGKGGDSDEYNNMLALYKEHRKKKVDDLKDYLRWNRQLLKGTKEFVLFKVLDGFVHGRLGYCGICGGTLKFNENDYEDYVHCGGRFDEDTKTPLPCDYKGDRLNCPRLKPWYIEAPTEEEEEEMDKLKEAAQEGGGGGGVVSLEENPEVQKLLKQAAKLDWNLAEKSGIQKATNDLVALVGKGKIDLPSGKTPKQILGPIVVANRESTPEDIVKVVIEKYGFAELKEKKAAAKEAAAEAVCENPKNAPLLMALKELAELYFKEGNRNAGMSYNKVVAAIKEMSVEITAKNAMGFSKGKSKVPGIGKSSAEKMKEFCASGKIEKLEEKRAANA